MTNQNPQISVLVAIYNVEKFLPRCIESVLAQTYTNLEIILVDDGSTDTSGEICDKYATKDSRIKVIHKKNGGLVSARNAGLDAASGKYIGFVDGDDWIEPQTYQTALELLQQHQVDLVKWGKNKVVQHQITPIVLSCQAGVYRNNNKSALLIQMIKGEGIDPNIVSCLFKNDIIKQYHLRTPLGLDQGEDVYFSTLYLAYATSLYVDLGLYFYNYRQNPLSLTKQYSPSYLPKISNFIETYEKFLSITLPQHDYRYAFYYRLNSMVFGILFVNVDFCFSKIPEKIQNLKKFYARFQSQFEMIRFYNTTPWSKRVPILLFYRRYFYMALFVTYVLKVIYICCVKVKVYV